MRKLIYGLMLIGLCGVAKATWDTTTPSGTEAKSLGDDRIRELKTDVQTALRHRGTFPGTDTANPKYWHKLSTGTTAGRPSGTDTTVGDWRVNTSSNVIEIYNGSIWVAVPVVANTTITETQLSTTVAGNGLSGGAGTALAVVLSTSFAIVTDSVTITTNGIASSMVQDSAIVTSKINNTAVDENKLNTSVAGNGISGGGGTALAVVISTTFAIVTDSITIVTNGIGNNMIQGGAVTASKISSTIDNWVFAGTVTAPNNPGFFAFAGSTQANVTGAGEIVTVNFASETFDTNGNYLTNTFTAPVTGKYAVAYSLVVQDVGVSEFCDTYVQYGSVKTLGFYQESSSVRVQMSGQGILSLTAGDALTVKVYCTGGSTDVDILYVGRQSDQESYFSATLVN